MEFLVDASLPRGTVDVLRRAGHAATDVREIGMAVAPDSEIARYARVNAKAIITADFDFADIRMYPPGEYAGIVVIHRHHNAKVADVLRIIERFLAEPRILDALVGRLAVVDRSRI